jgi:hypothetical protein
VSTLATRGPFVEVNKDSCFLPAQYSSSGSHRQRFFLLAPSIQQQPQSPSVHSVTVATPYSTRVACQYRMIFNAFPIKNDCDRLFVFFSFHCVVSNCLGHTRRQSSSIAHFNLLYFLAPLLCASDHLRFKLIRTMYRPRECLPKDHDFKK